MASSSGAFWEPKNAAEEPKLIENDTQSQQDYYCSGMAE